MFAKSVVKAFLILAIAMSSLGSAMTAGAEAGILKKYVVGRTLLEVEKRWARKAAKEALQRNVTSKLTRNFAKEILSPTPKNPGFQSFTKRGLESLERKIAARTATKQEIKRLGSYERFNARRQDGVNQFWNAEAQNLREGSKGTRNWSPAQQRDIQAAGKGRPTFQGEPMVGHHRFNARSYPQIADNPKNIYPATKSEHLNRWHGGDTRIPVHGTPRNPKFPEQF